MSRKAPRFFIQDGKNGSVLQKGLNSPVVVVKKPAAPSPPPPPKAQSK